MAKKIKGITIEIDGNTTPLQNALKDVNREIYSVNAELKQVDKLLKFDPGNVELLTQKQTLLGKSIKETSEKLKTLREAKEQADKRIASGEEDVASESYRELQREIIKTEQSLKNSEDAFKQTSNAIKNASDNTSVFADVLKADLLSSAIQKGLSSLVDLTKQLANQLVNVGKQAVESFSEYEQLVGGVDTIFGESSKKVQEYANNAYKTSGISANEYMKTVTSFSASLLQSLSGDTNKAAEIADMALQDMSDNANKFGTEMSSIQNAYQGFAKQNYTMLDNLKLGYGGTKTEMERLLKDAQKFSGIKYNISSLKDVYEAIHVIQKEMGVTGTTALEAGTTIQGSFSSMQAAWENLLTGLADGNADIGQLISNLVTTIVGDGTKNNLGIIGNILPAVKNVINQMPKIISNLIPQLIPIVKELITELINLITNDEFIELIMDSAFTLIWAFADALIDAAPKIIDKIPYIIEKIVTEFCKEENIIKMIQIGDAILDGIAQGLVDLGASFFNSISKSVNEMLKSFKEAVKNKDFSEIGEDIVNGIAKGMTTVTKTLTSISNPQSIVNTVTSSLIGKMKNAMGIHSPSKLFADEVGKWIPLGIAEGIEDTIPNTISDVENAMSKLNTGIEASVNPTINPTANSNPLIIQIENFNNTRESDIEDLAEELEFYRKRTATAVGGA